MSVPKGRQKQSKEEFDALYFQIHDDAEDMIEHNFRANAEIAAQLQSYIQAAGKALRKLVWDLIYHVKIANSLYPTTINELIERRVNQDKALGICFDILTLYEIVMRRLKVPDDMGVTEINHINHQINAIRAWRTSDNKRFRDLK